MKLKLPSKGLSRIGEVFENAFQNFGQEMEEFGERMERLQGRSVHLQNAADHYSWGGWSVPACRYEKAAVAAVAVETPAAPDAVR